MAYTFRFPFDLPETQRIGMSGVQALLATVDGHEVVLRSGTEVPIAENGRLEVRGRGYRSSTEAESDGARWMDALAVGLLQFNLAPDFRTRAMHGTYTQAGLEELAQLFKVPPGSSVVGDRPGVSVFKDEEMPARFIRTFATGLISGGFEDTPRAVEDAYSRGVSLDDATLVAIDLLSAYYRMPSVDAQFLTLVMATEALIAPAPLDGDSAAALKHAATSLRELGLPDDVRNSLEGRIRGLSQESIGQAGKKLANKLGDRTYGARTAPAFFTYCYGLRSRIAHGSTDRPDINDLHATTGLLVRFVKDLIELRTGGYD